MQTRVVFINFEEEITPEIQSILLQLFTQYSTEDKLYCYKENSKNKKLKEYTIKINAEEISIRLSHSLVKTQADDCIFYFAISRDKPIHENFGVFSNQVKINLSELHIILTKNELKIKREKIVEKIYRLSKNMGASETALEKWKKKREHEHTNTAVIYGPLSAIFRTCADNTEFSHKHYLFMPYFDAITLYEFSQQKLPTINDYFKVIKDYVLPAIKKFHKKGVVHRDLHLGNILINKENPIAHIIDFETMVKEGEKDFFNNFTDFITPPPQLNTDEFNGYPQNCNQAFDIYSLGIDFMYFLGARGIVNLCNPKPTFWIDIQKSKMRHVYSKYQVYEEKKVKCFYYNPSSNDFSGLFFPDRFFLLREDFERLYSLLRSMVSFDMEKRPRLPEIQKVFSSVSNEIYEKNFNTLIIEEIDKKIHTYKQKKLSLLFKNNLDMLNEFRDLLLNPANNRETLATLIEYFKKSNKLKNIGSDITDILADLEQKYYFDEDKLKITRQIPRLQPVSHNKLRHSNNQ